VTVPLFAPTTYLSWARRFYGKVPFDLATSGIPLAKIEAASGLDRIEAYRDVRRAIAHYNDVPEPEVLPVLGTSHAIFVAYAAACERGDELLVESPGYEPLVRAAEGLGLAVRTFERRSAQGFSVDADRVLAAIGPKTRGIVLSTLHNPTGVRVPDAVIADLAARAEPRGVRLFVDEVYAPLDRLTEGGVFRSSARKLSRNVVAFGSLTKAYGLGMLRLGWMLASAEIVERGEDVMLATVGHLPLSHAAIGAAALGSIDSYSARARALFEGKRAVVESWVATLRDAQWSAPTEGLFGMVTLPGRGDLTPRIEALAASKGVLVAAGAFFGAPESFRLSWATCPPAALEEALHSLAEIAS
jgi:aspartate/methionine/tyrosine aminotransferase